MSLKVLLKQFVDHCFTVSFPHKPIVHGTVPTLDHIAERTLFVTTARVEKISIEPASDKVACLKILPVLPDLTSAASGESINVGVSSADEDREFFPDPLLELPIRQPLLTWALLLSFGPQAGF